MHRSRIPFLGMAAAATLGALAFAVPAHADWHGRHDHWHPHGWYRGYYAPPPVVVAPRPYYYAPPAYYAPPPVVYAPPPAYYAPGVAVGVMVR